MTTWILRKEGARFTFRCFVCGVDPFSPDRRTSDLKLAVRGSQMKRWDGGSGSKGVEQVTILVNTESALSCLLAPAPRLVVDEQCPCGGWVSCGSRPRHHTSSPRHRPILRYYNAGGDRSRENMLHPRLRWTGSAPDYSSLLLRPEQMLH